MVDELMNMDDDKWMVWISVDGWWWMTLHDEE